MLGVLTQIYPATPQIGCLFHLSKNVFKHVQKLGLQQLYLNDQLFRSRIPALSFVVIEDTFAALEKLSNHRGALLDYFETYYIVELRRGIKHSVSGTDS